MFTLAAYSSATPKMNLKQKDFFSFSITLDVFSRGITVSLKNIDTWENDKHAKNEHDSSHKNSTLYIV